MVQNEINNMSFLTADNKSKMAKVGASLWEVDLARREGTPPRASHLPPPHPASCPSGSHSLQPSSSSPIPFSYRVIPYPPFLSPNFSELPSSGF